MGIGGIGDGRRTVFCCVDAGVALGQVVVVDAGGLELRGVKADAYIALLVGNAAVIRRKRGDDVAEMCIRDRTVTV